MILFSCQLEENHEGIYKFSEHSPKLNPEFYFADFPKKCDSITIIEYNFKGEKVSKQKVELLSQSLTSLNNTINIRDTFYWDFNYELQFYSDDKIFSFAIPRKKSSNPGSTNGVLSTVKYKLTHDNLYYTKRVSKNKNE